MVDDVAGTPTTKKVTVANLLAGVAASPRMRMAGFFETAARYTPTAGGGGAVTWSSSGMKLDTSATQNSYAKTRLTLYGGSGQNVDLGSPTFSTVLRRGNVGSDWIAYFGLGEITVTGTAMTFTDKHYGFKFVRAASGDQEVSATQADGTTESATLLSSTLTNDWDFILVVNATTSVDYYYRKAGGALSAATNISANMGTSLGQYIQWAVCNANVADDTTYQILAFCYER